MSYTLNIGKGFKIFYVQYVCMTDEKYEPLGWFLIDAWGLNL